MGHFGQFSELKHIWEIQTFIPQCPVVAIKVYYFIFLVSQLQDNHRFLKRFSKILGFTLLLVKKICVGTDVNGIHIKIQ